MYRTNFLSSDSKSQISNELRDRRLQRERQLAELNTAFHSLISEAEEKHEFIYGNVFTQHGEVHDEAKIRSIQESMKRSADSKTRFFSRISDASREEFHDHPADHRFHNFHKSLLLRRRRIFIVTVSIILSIFTVASVFAIRAFRHVGRFQPEVSKEVWDAYQVIQGALIDMGVDQGKVTKYGTYQYQAGMFLAEEAVKSDTNMDALQDQGFLERADDGEILNFNASYKQKRELLERFSLLTLWFSTTHGGLQPWRTSTNWATNSTICAWHGINCLEVQNQDSSMSLVSILDLSDNQLIGQIPNEISLLTDVHTIQLQNNNLTGEIPESLGSLNNLSKLHLIQNSFKGQLPDSICRLRSDNDGFLNSLIADCGGGFACQCCTVCL